MKPFILPAIYLFLLAASLLTESCSSRKDTVASVGMQNLTARYNVIYNAKLLIGQSEKKIEDAWSDDYEQLLSVYKEPTAGSSQAEIKNLDSAIAKANFIVSDKDKSNYVGEAYFLKGKSNYLKGSYFNASEFFNYVYVTYPEEKELKQAALVWKARSLLQLNNLSESSIVLDTAFKSIKTEKKSVADIYATVAQLYIRSGHERDAIGMIQNALKFEKHKALKIRWTYLLAQLQERNNELQASFANYTKIIKSNAPFEMAFNANLNRIHIEEQQNDRTENQITRLSTLLKDNKNKEFIDQIWYRIAWLYQERNDEKNALESYNRSISKSIKNQGQKGLSYLNIAEIYFKNGDYAPAKKYYDSTLAALPPSYPNYEAIRLKSSNLDLLADRFKTIAREDTLQSLARLPKAQLDLRLDALLREQIQTAVANAPVVLSSGNTKFYFNNATALSQGMSAFKQRWGTRRLEDNWRRSTKSAADAIPVISAINLALIPVLATNSGGIDSLAMRKSYMDNIPFTPAQLGESNEKIINAYYDIAGFYKDVLKDDKEAISTYQEILKRYPDNHLKPVIYYNLYRLYAASDPPRSAEYKDRLLKQYPQTAFAQVILDPDYARKADEKASALNQAYDNIYNQYIRKDYTGVITQIAEASQKFGINPFSPQLAYLNALATGRTQKTEAFEAALQKIVQTYPDDKLITPLVKQNLEYVKANQETLNRRTFALIDFDPNEPVFVLEPKPEPVTTQSQAVMAPSTNVPANISSPVQKTDVISPVVKLPPPSSIFSLPDSAEYYFVFNVLTPRTNLTPSRYGIGQFNRSNYPREKISHQLKQVNRENQLIFVGPFSTKDDAERYQYEIVPLVKDIMKISANDYNTFIITKTGLDKLTTRNMINMYLEFYKGSNR